MPRRALILITALVLALHWLVLHGVPLAWESPAQPLGRVFSTRSIAAPPPPPPPAAEPAAATPAAPKAPARKPQPKRPRPEEQEKAPPSPPPPPLPEAPVAPEESFVASAGPEAAPMEAPGATEAASATELAASTPTAPASEPPAPPPVAASAPDSAPEGASAGVDIAAPPGTGQAPSTAPPPVRLPAPARLAFDVRGQAKKFAYSARAELLWQHDGSRYEARQEISAFLVGTRAQRSTGAITAQGLQPERFSDKSRSEQAAHFDHAKGRVTFSANRPEAAVGPGAQDRLSLFIQLGALLAADPGRFVPGTQITLTTVSARSADRWTFSVEGPQTLDLPIGPTPTLKLQRLPRKDYDQKAELWVAPSLNYLPVRIRLTQANGDFADLQLSSSSPP